VSLEGPNQLDELLEKANEYNQWGSNVVIKVPMLANGDGIKAAHMLEEQNIKTNVTAMMNLNQAFLAINAGASYASLFFNRIRDSGGDPVEIVKQARAVIDEGGYKTKLIVGSIRSSENVTEIITTDPHIVTIPYKILKQMPFHERTVSTLEEFDKAWKEFKSAEKSY
jgi:transaldolase